MRFDLARFWKIYLKLIKTLILLEDYYLLLIRSFLLLNKQTIDENIDEIYAIICDNLYRRVQLFLIDFRLFDALVIDATSNSSKLSS